MLVDQTDATRNGCQPTAGPRLGLATPPDVAIAGTHATRPTFVRWST
jgi:hypothetical protein